VRPCTDVLVRIERLDGTTQVARLTPSSPSFVAEAAPGWNEVAATYLILGVEHILLGIDHLLFVLALLLIVSRRWGVLLKTINAFTVAHSITLAMAALDVVHVPAAPIEAIIVLSIVFVASEIVHTRAGRPGLTARAPWVVAFTFGLLHGFGFASALSEVGLPENSIPAALLMFNVGVEIGQLLFVAAAIALIAALGRVRVSWPKWAEFIPPYAIGGCAAFGSSCALPSSNESVRARVCIRCLRRPDTDGFERDGLGDGLRCPLHGLTPSVRLLASNSTGLLAPDPPRKLGSDPASRGPGRLNAPRLAGSAEGQHPWLHPKRTA